MAQCYQKSSTPVQLSQRVFLRDSTITHKADPLDHNPLPPTPHTWLFVFSNQPVIPRNVQISVGVFQAERFRLCLVTGTKLNELSVADSPDAAPVWGQSNVDISNV